MSSDTSSGIPLGEARIVKTDARRALTRRLIEISRELDELRGSWLARVPYDPEITASLYDSEAAIWTVIRKLDPSVIGWKNWLEAWPWTQ